MSEGRETSGATTERTRANREASNWLVLLHEEPGDEDLRSQFTLWLNESAANATAWAETDAISRVIQTTPPAYAERWQTPGSNIVPLATAREGIARQRKARTGRVGRYAGGLAGIAAAACLAVIAVPEMQLHMRADVLTATGETRAVRLHDGSVLTLAPQSAVAINVSKGGDRKLQILRGTAYFDVAKDPDHPFQVAAADTTTTVLGTAFEVRQTNGEKVSVSVRRGHVAVACNDHPDDVEHLLVGDALDLACAAGGRARRTVEPSRIAAWTDGQIVVSDRPVSEVIDALRPWHHGMIVTFGNGFERRRVTGAYDARDPDRVLTAIARSHHMGLRSVTPWITVVTAD